MRNPADILKNPADYGIRFDDDTVRVGGRGDKGSPYTVPIMTVTDVDKFEKSFPGVLLSAANGQSIRVTSQRIGRDGAARGVDAEAIRLQNVQWLLHIKVRAIGVVKIYLGPNGEEYTDEETQKQAWIEFVQNQ